MLDGEGRGHEAWSSLLSTVVLKTITKNNSRKNGFVLLTHPRSPPQRKIKAGWKQRPWRNTAYLFPLPGLHSSLSHISQDTCPGMALCSEAGSHMCHKSRKRLPIGQSDGGLLNLGFLL